MAKIVSSPLQFTRSDLAQRVVQEHANVLQRRKGEIYVHYFNTDKRLDDWVPEDTVHLLEEQPQASSSSNVPNGRKRKRKQQPGRVGSSTSPVRQDSVETAVEEPEPEPPLLQEDVQLTEEEFDYQKHKQMTGQRNYDKVNFGTWQIKTWCGCFLLFPKVHRRRLIGEIGIIHHIL